MKKSIFYFLAMMFAFTFDNVVFAQATHTIDFEPGGVGAGWNWTIAENGDNPPLEFVANPASGGINTSATAAKFTALQGGQPYALFFTDDNGQFTFDADNSTVSLMIYKSVVSPIHIKFEGLSGATDEIIASNTVTDQWEELTFDFSAFIGKTYNRLVIIPDDAARSQDNIIYIDNIQVPEGQVVVIPSPAVHAPTPAAPASDVISIFSGAYSNLPGVNLSPNWGQSTEVTFADVQGDTTMRYGNLNYQGMELNQNLNLDSAGMKYIHIDFWNANSTELNFFLISPGPNQQSVALIPPDTTGQQWFSVDIPLTQFQPTVDLTQVFQMMFTGNGTVYLDNIYFTKTPAKPLNVPTTLPPAPTAPSENVISIFSNNYENLQGVNLNPYWEQSTVFSFFRIENDSILSYSNLNFQGIELNQNLNLDSAGMQYLHVDFWNANSSELNMFLISPGPSQDSVAIIPVDTTKHQWISVDIPLSQFQPNVDLTKIYQMMFTGNGTVYVDNLYFSAVPTDVKEDKNTVVTDYSLEQNYPNPFNPSTTINFSIPHSSNVKLILYDITGRKVKELINTQMTAGSYNVIFDASNLASGTYIYRIEAGNFVQSKKMILLK